MDHPDQNFWKVQVYRGLELIFHLWRQAMTGEQMKYILHRMKISHITLLFKCLVDLDMKSNKMEGFHSYVPLRCISTFYTKSKSIHRVNSSARSSFFEKGIILTKPFQASRADISCHSLKKGSLCRTFYSVIGLQHNQKLYFQ